MNKGSLFSTSSITLVISYLCDNSHSHRYEGISLCVSVCFSLKFHASGPSFHVPVAVCMSSLEKCLLQSSAHVSSGFFFSSVELYEIFICFEY